MKEIEFPKPRACTIDLTEGCNLACDYCFTHSLHNRKVISEEMGKTIIRLWLEKTDYQNRNDVEIGFWGGEPLLEFDLLKKLANYTKEITENKVDKFSITTNGTLYTEEIVEWSLENKMACLISLDGNEESHDMHRKFKNGKGSWKVIDSNIRKAMKINPNQRVRVSIAADTLHLLYDSFIYIIEDLGIKSFAFSPVFEGDWNQENWKLLEYQFNRFADYTIKEAKKGNHIILKHFKDEMINGGNLKEKQNPCGAGNGYSAWSVDGIQFPCHRFNKHGLSTEERLKSPFVIGRIIDNKYFMYNEAREPFVSFKDKTPIKCEVCNIFRRSSCVGNCYAVNYDLTGDINVSPDVCCTFNKIQHKIGMRLEREYRDNNIKMPFETVRDKKNTPSGCVCYNMCYAEGTENEIIHFDKRNNGTCNCYQVSYSDNIGFENSRKKNEIQKDDDMLKTFLNLSKKILANNDKIDNKTKEMKDLENDVLSKTIGLLERKNECKGECCKCKK